MAELGLEPGLLQPSPGPWYLGDGKQITAKRQAFRDAPPPHTHTKGTAMHSQHCAAPKAYFSPYITDNHPILNV